MIERNTVPVPPSTVSAGLAAGLVDYAVGRGADRADLLRSAGLTAQALADPDARLAFGAYVALLRGAEVALGDPAFALRLGEAVGMSKTSIVGLIMEASATMGEAFAQMQRYGRLAMAIAENEEGPGFALEMDGGRLMMVDHRRSSTSVPELVETDFARLVCGPRRFLPEPHVLSVEFARPQPSYWKEAERVFACPVRFGAGRNALELHPGIAGWPVARSPRYVFGVLTARADELIGDVTPAATVRAAVEAEVAKVLHLGEVRSDAISASLGMSRQTLFRRLSAEGTTFSAVLDGLRLRLASGYLKGGKVSVGETAYLVGFSDAAAFSRAFKRWTGVPPSEFRRHARGVGIARDETRPLSKTLAPRAPDSRPC